MCVGHHHIQDLRRRQTEQQTTKYMLDTFIIKTKTNRTTNNKIYAGHLHNQDEDKQKNKHNAICGGTTIRNQTQIT